MMRGMRHPPRHHPRSGSLHIEELCFPFPPCFVFALQLRQTLPAVLSVPLHKLESRFLLWQWRSTDVDPQHVAEPQVFAHALVHHLFMNAAPSRVALERPQRKILIPELAPHADYFYPLCCVCFDQECISHSRKCYPNFPNSTPCHAQLLRVAIDTGGTFTDCVWIDCNGRLRMLKVFSTPADPSQAIVEALRKIDHDSELVILHGTTVGTNTLLERKGARTALITTAGFEDAIEIGRQARPKLYDFFFDRVEPLVARDLRFGVKERTACDGEILTAPSPEDLKLLAS